MARFTNLHHVGEVIVDALERHLDPRPNGTVQVGPPLEVATGPAEDVRVTLLWTTVVGSRRNDGWTTGPGGEREPPLLTLEAHVLITTYGSAAEDPVRAYELLGQTMRIFQTYSVLALPSQELPDVGRGELSMTLIPSTFELMEQVFTPLQLRHRPWVVYEVGPIELDSMAAARAPLPAVRPGGLQLSGPIVLAPPRITGITPSQQAQGGVIRVELERPGPALSAILFDELSSPADDAIALDGGTTWIVRLPELLTPGLRSIRIEVGDDDDPPRQFSGRESLEVLPAATPTLDALATASHSLAEALTLTGRALTQVVALVLWPDRPLAAPDQVKRATPTQVTEHELLIDAAALAAAELGPGRWRVSAELVLANGALRFTPHVMVELRP